jgi:hypothetical protein
VIHTPSRDPPAKFKHVAARGIGCQRTSLRKSAFCGANLIDSTVPSHI